MRSVSRVDDRLPDQSRQQVRGARRAVADDDDIGVHGFEVMCRVDKCFPFDHRAGGGGNVYRIGA